ncbi:MAG: PEP/pyruvate-binding domain-containing protein [Candidatus Electryonea clarkiae]|nr:PEP/pyruvate-binding domain-containing protein [Candidatus Electryonea clarkiae]MDP8286439.1 PEP/pyruvate-binding domain-containing protein [Candidatus Electryonea clarkiae]
MPKQKRKVDSLIDALQERAKELNCLYQVEEILINSDISIDEVFEGIIKAIPTGYQYPDICQAKITFEGNEYQPAGFSETSWAQFADIKMHDNTVGLIGVYYTKEMPTGDKGPFLKEEAKLIQTIADRIGHYILHQHLKDVVENGETAKQDISTKRLGDWKVAVDLLHSTDLDLFRRISRHMMNYLCWNGVQEAEEILQQLGQNTDTSQHTKEDGGNRPSQKRAMDNTSELGFKIFDIASKHIPDDEILECIQRWMLEDKLNFLIRTVINLDSTLPDISDALRRFAHLSKKEMELSDSNEKGVKVALVRRLISDQLDFIKIAKDYIKIHDFYNLFPQLIYPPNSHGLLGGKSAGLFLASRILKIDDDPSPNLRDIKIPKTWHVTSDGLHTFLHHNNLQDVTEQKYKEIGIVRQEYPHVVQLFKNSYFTQEIIQGLSMALDDFGEVPLIVRSSSLLEDRLGSAFSGKYTSLFLANQGSKHERVEALCDAIAEVYASTFGPDPIEYRAERDLIDFHEQMAIMIQEVVGKTVGNYFFPAFAGVVFSNNEFRWSSRIKREDGLIRLVAGLGTRAVDRLSDDYAILIAPGKPDLRVNTTADEAIRYAPHMMDVINLETNTFDTIEINQLLREFGDELPYIDQMVSVVDGDMLRLKSRLNIDFENDELVVNFEGLISKTSFTAQVKEIIDVLQKAMGVPVDIEFASDGKHFYLLQCRPQGHSSDVVAMPIPKDIPENAIVFNANRYVSNGRVPDITNIVYVDPQKYSEIDSAEGMMEIGRAVGKLNKQLPKRQFILLGPGRWGSRGDIKLGVDVTYSDISNTAMLIEIARKRGNYVPDLSFGTHFFQDLVESSIRYLPLYPDDDDIIFNEFFLTHSKNLLPDILPKYAHLSDVLRVIDVPGNTSGKILKVFMNADLDEAVGILTLPTGTSETFTTDQGLVQESDTGDHWRWRSRMSEVIAKQLGVKDYGVVAFYIFGSTKNGTAGAGSDIDILLHFNGSKEQRKDLLNWLEGWSICLDEINYLRTGYRSGALLDVHLVTDEDITNRSSYAVKIGAITDAAKQLPMK